VKLEFFILLKIRTSLDPGLRRGDILKTVGLKIVTPAQAGVQCLFWLCVKASELQTQPHTTQP
jgi:hypothetical protein